MRLGAGEKRGGASWAGERELGRLGWAERGREVGPRAEKEKGADWAGLGEWAGACRFWVEEGKRAGPSCWAENDVFFLFSFAKEQGKFNLNLNSTNSNSN